MEGWWLYALLHFISTLVLSIYFLVSSWQRAKTLYEFDSSVATATDSHCDCDWWAVADNASASGSGCACGCHARTKLYNLSTLVQLLACIPVIMYRTARASSQ